MPVSCMHQALALIPLPGLDADENHSDGARHSPYGGANVKRAFNATDTTTLEDYEYVVVGSSAGGSPLAARLALAGYKVLLLEAGGDETNSPEYRVPVLHAVAAEYE